jgi:hypothetical protein
MYFHPSTGFVTKSRTMRWAGHVSYIGRGEVGKPDKRDHLEDTGLEERLILKCVFKRQERSLDWVDLTQDTDRWRAVAIVVTFWFHKIKGIS